MSICPRCKATFTCCMADQTGKDCWCGALPPLKIQDLPASSTMAANPDTSCYCPTCLKAWQAERMAANPNIPS